MRFEFKRFIAESTGHAFMMDILQNPKDGGTYLIYADWLSDNGMDAVADFIRSVFARNQGVRGQLAQHNNVIKSALPQIRQLVSPYLWDMVRADDYHISMQAANQDTNTEYVYFFNNYPNYHFSRSIWGQEWITTNIPGKVLIAEPKQGRVASGDIMTMDELRDAAEQWEVPYIGNIVKNPPDNLLHAMVLGNLHNKIPSHIRRQKR